MNNEPIAIITSIRFLLNGIVQGLILWHVLELTTEQHAWLTVTVGGMIEAVLWLITRNEVWAPSGAPTHPPTEALWANKLAAEVEKVESLFTAPGHSPSEPLSHAANVAMVDNINPGIDDV